MNIFYENGIETGISPLKTLTNTHFEQNMSLTDVDCDWCVQAELQGPGPSES